MLTSWWKRAKDDAEERDQDDGGGGGGGGDDDDDAAGGDSNSERALRRTPRAGNESGEQQEADRAPSSLLPPEELVSFRIRHVARDRWVIATVPRSCRVCKLVEAAVARCDDQLGVGGRPCADAETNDHEPRTDGPGRHRRRHSWFMALVPPSPAVNTPPPAAFVRHELAHVRVQDEHSPKPSRTSVNVAGSPSPTIRPWKSLQSVLCSLRRAYVTGPDGGDNVPSRCGETDQKMAKLRDECAIFWANAGHWLDESRTLASYHLDPAVDVLELQLRRRFVRVSYADGRLGDHHAEGHLLRLHRSGRHGDIARSGSWKRRWFVLRKGRLECRRSEKEHFGHVESFDISALARVTTPIAHDESHHPVERHVMSLEFVDRADDRPAATSVVLRAETAADFGLWTRVFRSIASENLASSSCGVPPSPSSPGSVPPGWDSPSLATDTESDASSAAGVVPLLPRRAPSERGGSLPEERAGSGREEVTCAKSRGRPPPLSTKLREEEKEHADGVRDAGRVEGWTASRAPAERPSGAQRQGGGNDAGQGEEGNHLRALLGPSAHEVVTGSFRAAMARELTRRELVGPLA